MTSAEAAALRDLVLSGKTGVAALDRRKLAAAYVTLRSPADDPLASAALSPSCFARNWRSAAGPRLRRDG